MFKNITIYMDMNQCGQYTDNNSFSHNRCLRYSEIIEVDTK